jgi:light-regulated signal transduction histidine kinase (bacteriophytochrome)
VVPGAEGPPGFGYTVDYRGHPVLGADDRLGDLGLVGVLKVDAAEIHGSTGRRFGGAIGLGVLLTSIGAWLVWRRVRPLATALEKRVWERTTELWQANARLAESEQQLRRLNEELDERVRLRTAELMAANQELEAFSYSVSHDLRAPLRHIDGFTGLLESHVEPTLDNKGRRYLKTISEAAKQMGALIDGLLTFSRLGRAELRHTPVRLQELVDEVRRILDPEIGGRAVVWAIGELPEVQGDPQLLRLVLQNLIGNALKYTRTKPEARIEIGARREGTETVCFIRDNGVGFDMRYRERLFEVFQRLHTSAEFEGTGIGLANVRRIVHRHGGRVWADGGVDRGACFSFALPNRSIAPAAEPPQSA